MNKAIFKGNFGNDSWYTTDDNGVYTVYLGTYEPDETFTSVTGHTYFLIDEDRLLTRKSSKSGKTYFKILKK